MSIYQMLPVAKTASANVLFVAMDEYNGFLARGLRQALLKQGGRLLVPGHDAGRAAIAGGRRNRRVGNLGKPPDFLDSIKLHISRAAA
jgi:hypothetical protein